MIRCPVCRRTHHGPEALVEHMLGHTKQGLIETLLERIMPCGKKRFNTQAQAERALVINTISTNPMRKETHAYKCVQCHPACWHLTSKVKRTQEVAS
jgi:hypothetical protein